MKVSYSKSDLQDYSMSLLLVPVDRPHTVPISLRCDYMYMSMSYTVYEVLSAISLKKLKKARDMNISHSQVIYHACASTRQH